MASEPKEKPLHSIVEKHFAKGDGQPLELETVTVEMRGHVATVRVIEPKVSAPEVSQEAAA